MIRNLITIIYTPSSFFYLYNVLTAVVTDPKYEVRKLQSAQSSFSCFLRLSVYKKFATECICFHMCVCMRERERERERGLSLIL